MSANDMHQGGLGKILVVDDIVSNLKLIQNILTEKGYTVRPATSGELALRSVVAEIPDLILLDVKMPGMNGYEVCRRLKKEKETAEIPVIFISVLEETTEKVKGFEVGGVDYITKPFDPEEVLVRVRTHLELRRLNVKLASAYEHMEEKVVARTAALQEQVCLLGLTAEIGAFMTRSDTLEKVLEMCCQSLIIHLDAVNTSIWTCLSRKDRLNLKASSGIPMGMDDAPIPISIDSHIIGGIGAARTPYISHSVIKDPKVSHEKWTRESGVTSFAGYPLLIDDELLGVMAIYANEPTSDPRMKTLAALADMIAIGIQRKKSEAGLIQSNRILKILSECNQILVWATDESALLSLICSTIVTIGGYRMVWVGYAENDPDQTIRQVAEAGHTGHYLKDLRLTWANGKKNQRPIEKAIQSRDIVVFEDIAVDSSPDLWRDAAMKEGYGATIVFPLLISEQCFGALVLYSSEKKIFGEREMKLLKELADDMAYGIQSLRDRIALKRTVGELKQSEGTLRAIFEATTDGILLVDTESKKFLTGNHAILKMLGYSLKELPLMGLGDIHPKAHLADVYDQLSRQIKKEMIVAESIPVKRRDGSVFYADISASPLTIDNKAYLVHIFRDITQRKQTEERLRQAQKMESIGTLAGGIAHDFNNILSSIIGYTELALEDVEKETVLKDNLEEVYSAGKRAKDLVKQILAFARQAEEVLKPIPVDNIAKEVLKFIRSSIPATIDITQHLQSHSQVMGNATQIHQMLMNLCTNSAYAMEEEGGTLSVTLKDITIDRDKRWEDLNLRRGNYIEMTVSDTGFGIAPDIIDSIFDPYFTTKHVGEGTGMGLAMVHGIVETYGGKIWVVSELGKGTTFSIYLPVTQNRCGDQQSEEKNLPLGNERILFVDDERSIVQIGQQVLERLGYSVTSCTSSRDALNRFSTKPDDFDLVITDMTMPDITGDTLAMELIKIRPDISIIICTGYSKKMDSQKASEIGIKAFAYKPLVKGELAKTVRKVLDEAGTNAS